MTTFVNWILCTFTGHLSFLVELDRPHRCHRCGKMLEAVVLPEDFLNEETDAQM